MLDVRDDSHGGRGDGGEMWGVAARDGEWCGGSYGSGEGEYSWGSSVKLAGKVFRRRRWWPEVVRGEEAGG
nr:hypothetical protein [Tanacetum cinerariifolium]